MPKYRVILRETIFGEAVVRAESIKQAKDKVLGGKGDFDEQVDWNNDSDVVVDGVEMIPDEDEGE